MPIGYLSDQGLVNTTASPTTVPGLRGDAQAAANFFGDICAANNNTQGPVLPPGQNFSAKWADLCTACKVRAHPWPGCVPYVDCDFLLMHPWPACVYYVDPDLITHPCSAMLVIHAGLL